VSDIYTIIQRGNKNLITIAGYCSCSLADGEVVYIVQNQVMPHGRCLWKTIKNLGVNRNLTVKIVTGTISLSEIQDLMIELVIVRL
jgi:hypothetical protein